MPENLEDYCLSKAMDEAIDAPVLSKEDAIALPQQKLHQFCQHWHISELSLFGSILRDDFRSDSDIDFLVEFSPNTQWGLLDHVKMQQELMDMLGRDVDLISKRAIINSSNWIRRDEILNHSSIHLKMLTPPLAPWVKKSR